MPARVHAIASEEKDCNRLAGVVPVLAGLLEQDARVRNAYLCRDNVEHIYKVKGEGNHFCGYRNIQMLLSCTTHGKTSDDDSKVRRHGHSIIQLQTHIEEAWANGINSDALIETGGIKDTRKHIGTAEVRLCETHRNFEQS